MLRIHFGSLPDEIYNTEMYYENQYDMNWVMDEFARRVIRDIDASEVIGPDLIQNTIFGTFPSTELSAGVKTLLLIHNDPKKIFNVSNCGDNCSKWILKLGKQKDLTIKLHHIMEFEDEDFEIEILNNHMIVHNMAELVNVAVEYI